MGESLFEKNVSIDPGTPVLSFCPQTVFISYDIDSWSEGCFIGYGCDDNESSPGEGMSRKRVSVSERLAVIDMLVALAIGYYAADREGEAIASDKKTEEYGFGRAKIGWQAEESGFSGCYDTY